MGWDGVERYLPAIEGIYHESLTAPFHQAGQQIEDPKLKAGLEGKETLGEYQ